ncbi:MAG: tRNA preQ1(34) S-adenosylmethionine ribosyltransferase-isomerase QueA [Herpetosiphonaceae bacterium]|nr:tRNA preQ1(34) S-adenosylmethionine ribosyltransferase-isomerase QueA [Herpetosiphonaceae bacterium]
MLSTADFDYYLPPSLIAQTPVEPRDRARLLVLNRANGAISHHQFRDLLELLRPGDLLVANESRVLQARLWGRKSTGGKIEVLLLRRRTAQQWEALVRGKGLDVDSTLWFDVPEQAELLGEQLQATVRELLPSGGRLLEFNRTVEPLLPRLGAMPLPPYIHTPLHDPERYQTVYSQTPGSAAAPTAGLHFTPELLAELRAKGVEWATVTLHVGLDTFRPVQVADVHAHQMHSEYFELPQATAETINRAKAEGRRVIAVGTTTVRVLETAGQSQSKDGQYALHAMHGDTSIFIYPPYRFRVIDGLITNFHLPKSTLLMLVSALAGKEHILQAYQAAVTEEYRFFSFGDAMLII